MTVQCPRCGTQYRVPDARLSDSRPVFKCTRCNHVFSSGERPASRARAASADTLLYLDGVTVVTRHNGVERQRAQASDMVFPIPMLLAYVSRYITLEAGDLPLTGTPAGVHPIAPGDTVEIELVGLSKVSSPVRAGR